MRKVIVLAKQKSWCAHYFFFTFQNSVKNEQSDFQNTMMSLGHLAAYTTKHLCDSITTKVLPRTKVELQRQEKVKQKLNPETYTIFKLLFDS